MAGSLCVLLRVPHCAPNVRTPLLLSHFQSSGPASSQLPWISPLPPPFPKRNWPLWLFQVWSLKKKKKVSFSFSFHVDSLKPKFIELSSLITFLETEHLDVSGKSYTKEILNHKLTAHEPAELHLSSSFCALLTPPTWACTRHTMP